MIWLAHMRVWFCIPCTHVEPPKPPSALHPLVQLDEALHALAARAQGQE